MKEREQESTGRQIAKIGRPHSATEPQGHIGADGRRYYTIDEMFVRTQKKLSEIFDAKEL